MKKPSQPTADERARAAAVRLQVVTGWYAVSSGGRVVLRLTPAEADRIGELFAADWLAWRKGSMSGRAKAAVKVHTMDASYGPGYRVTGVASPEEAISAATIAWQQEALDLDETPPFQIESHGWYRCIPCICGEGHQYDVWPAKPHARGATYTYLVGVQP